MICGHCFCTQALRRDRAAATMFFRRVGLFKSVINIQRDGNKAKAYQVRQVREVILGNELAGHAEVAAQDENGDEQDAD